MERVNCDEILALIVVRCVRFESIVSNKRAVNSEDEHSGS